MKFIILGAHPWLKTNETLTYLLSRLLVPTATSMVPTPSPHNADADRALLSKFRVPIISSAGISKAQARYKTYTWIMVLDLSEG